VNIVQAFTDPRVLGFAFGGESWRTWRVLLAGVFGLPLSPEDSETFTRLTHRAAPGALVREWWAIFGRRGGKSIVIAGVVDYLATMRRWTLSPGETGTVMLLASDRDQAKVAFRYCLGLLQDSPILSQEIASTTADSIRLRSGIEIVVGTADRAAVRGRTLLCTVCDEIAFWSVLEAGEVLRAVRPGMASQPEAMLICISTAYAQRGPLFDTYRRSFGVEDPQVLVMRGATRDTNPSISQAFIDAEIARDPQAARAEYLGEFRGDVSSFLPEELIDAAIVLNRRSLPRSYEFTYVAHCDPSGGVNDAMTLAICHLDHKQVVLDKLVHAPAPFNPEDIVIKFAEVLSAYGLNTVSGDRYGEQWVSSSFRRHGVTYVPSLLSTSATYLEVQALFSQKLVQLLDEPILEDELRSLERRVGRAGRADIVDHPPHMHDDAAAAVCGGLVTASKQAWMGRSMMQPQGYRHDLHKRGLDYDPYTRFRKAASED